MANDPNHLSELPTKSISFSISLPQWLVDLVDAEDAEKLTGSRSAIIAAALKEHFERIGDAEIIAEAKANGYWKRLYARRVNPSC